MRYRVLELSEIVAAKTYIGEHLISLASSSRSVGWGVAKNGQRK